MWVAMGDMCAMDSSLGINPISAQPALRVYRQTQVVKPHQAPQAKSTQQTQRTTEPDRTQLTQALDKVMDKRMDDVLGYGSLQGDSPKTLDWLA